MVRFILSVLNFLIIYKAKAFQHIVDFIHGFFIHLNAKQNVVLVTIFLKFFKYFEQSVIDSLPGCANTILQLFTFLQKVPITFNFLVNCLKIGTSLLKTNFDAICRVPEVMDDHTQEYLVGI